MVKITTDWGDTSKNTTDFSDVTKNTTDFSDITKNTTDFTDTSKNTSRWEADNNVLANATKLNDTTVKLNSSTVTLLGFTAGSHFYDNKNNTDWGDT